MTSQSLGLPEPLMNNILISEDIPQLIERLWEFSGLEDQDMWNEQTTPGKVINHCLTHLLEDLPDNHGIGIFNGEAFYTRIVLGDPSEEPFDVEWIDEMTIGRKLFMTAIGYLSEVGCSNFQDFGMDDYLNESMLENIEFYKDSADEKEEIQQAKATMLAVQYEIRFFDRCDKLKDIPMEQFLKSYKRLRKRLPEAYCHWMDCVIDIVSGGLHLEHLDHYGYESFDDNNGNGVASNNFIMCVGRDGVWEEVKAYNYSTISEVGYTPGLQASPTREFKDDYTLFEKLIDLNYECVKCCEGLQRSKSGSGSSHL